MKLTQLTSVFLALIILFLSGLLHGNWTNRWSTPQTLKVAAVQFSKVPMSIGEWDAQPLEISDRELQQAKITGYIFRKYLNRRTTEAVSVLLVCGPSGPISVHSPDVCYRGAGYELADKPVRFRRIFEGVGKEAEFWTGQFNKEDGGGFHRLRFLWTWRGRNGWQAPDIPRATFAGLPALVKLYVFRSVINAEEPLEDDSCVELLEVLLPELEQAISRGDSKN